MFPFHTWLPDAHTEAPTAGSVILAAVMLKLGAYGFIRFAVPLFPAAAQTFAPVIIVLSLIAIIYGAIVALVQPDLKRLVAYSSVSHMGFVTLGIFVFTQQGLQGAILQMINHGLITGALFLLVGVIYERTHDRTIAKMGGLAARTPVYAAVFGFFVFASAGLPGLSGFVGEFLVLVGTFEVEPGGRGGRDVRDDPGRRLPAVHVRPGRLRRGVRLPRLARRPPDRHDPGRDPDPGPARDARRGLRPPARAPAQPVLVDRHRHARRSQRRRRRSRSRPTIVAGLLALVLLVVIARIVWALLKPRRTAAARARRRGGPLSWQDFVTISPLVAGILTAAAILVVDLIRPGKAAVAVATALIGLAITAGLTIAVGPAVGAAVTAFGGAYQVDAADDLPRPAVHRRSSR